MEYHNPKGVYFPQACDRAGNVCAVYVARHKEGLDSYKRFMRSLAKTTSSEYGLFVVYKGFPNIETAYEDWHPHCPHGNVSAMMMADYGYDLTAYRMAAEMVSSPVLVFFNSNTEILSSHWPELFVAALNKPGVGLVGATGSWESFQKGLLRRMLFPAWPNPHVRTNAFAMRRDLFLRIWPKRFRTKWGCYLFESGHNSLTRRAWRHSKRPVVIGSTGRISEWWEWNTTATFRAFAQASLVAADCRTRDYSAANDEVRASLRTKTWGI